MSTIEVNKITPVSGGTTVQVGESGDTINIPAGATIANAGTATGFGVSLTNGVDNRIVTSSSATALNGESELTFDGTLNIINNLQLNDVIKIRDNQYRINKFILCLTKSSPVFPILRSLAANINRRS